MRTKRFFLFGNLVLSILACNLCLARVFQTDLEGDLRNLLLNEHGFTESEFHQVVAGPGKKAEATLIMMRLLKENRYSQPGSIDAKILDGAIWMLAFLKAKVAVPLLSDLLSDQRAFKNNRSGAALALGNIDPTAAKKALISALDPQNSDYPYIRIHAAEALAKTKEKDAEVLKILQKYAAQEKDDFVRQRFEGAIRTMRQSKNAKPQ